MRDKTRLIMEARERAYQENIRLDNKRRQRNPEREPTAEEMFSLFRPEEIARWRAFVAEVRAGRARATPEGRAPWEPPFEKGARRSR